MDKGKFFLALACFSFLIISALLAVFYQQQLGKYQELLDLIGIEKPEQLIFNATIPVNYYAYGVLQINDAVYDIRSTPVKEKEPIFSISDWKNFVESNKEKIYGEYSAIFKEIENRKLADKKGLVIPSKILLTRKITVPAINQSVDVGETPIEIIQPEGEGWIPVSPDKTLRKDIVIFVASDKLTEVNWDGWTIGGVTEDKKDYISFLASYDPEFQNFTILDVDFGHPLTPMAAYEPKLQEKRLLVPSFQDSPYFVYYFWPDNYYTSPSLNDTVFRIYDIRSNKKYTIYVENLYDTIVSSQRKSVFEIVEKESIAPMLQIQLDYTSLDFSEPHVFTFQTSFYSNVANRTILESYGWTFDIEKGELKLD